MPERDLFRVQISSLNFNNGGTGGFPVGGHFGQAEVENQPGIYGVGKRYLVSEIMVWGNRIVKFERIALYLKIIIDKFGVFLSQLLVSHKAAGIWRASL